MISHLLTRVIQTYFKTLCERESNEIRFVQDLPLWQVCDNGNGETMVKETGMQVGGGSSSQPLGSTSLARSSDSIPY